MRDMSPFETETQTEAKAIHIFHYIHILILCRSLLFALLSLHSTKTYHRHPISLSYMQAIVCELCVFVPKDISIWCPNVHSGIATQLELETETSLYLRRTKIIKQLINN